MKKEWIIVGVVMLLVIPIASAPAWYGSGDDTGLAGRWSCEGNFKDSSGQGNHGTQTGGVTITSGVKGRACGFDGVNDFITLPTNNNTLMVNNATFSAWFNIRRFGGANNYAELYGTYYTWLSNVTNIHVSPTFMDLQLGTVMYYYYYNFSINTWYHTSVVIDRTTNNATVYVNGAAIGTQNFTGYITTGGPVIGYIRRSANPLDFFNGSIDEVRIYNRTLSATEISDLYNTSKTYYFTLKTTPVLGGLNDTPAPILTDETGLVGYWKMDDLVNGNTTDSSGQGNNGSVIGATYTSAGRWSGAFLNEGKTASNTNRIVPTQNGALPVLMNVSTQPFTVSAWWKPRLFTADAIVVGREGYNVGLLSDGDGFRCSLVNWTGASLQATAGSCNGVDNWCFGACVYNGTHWSAYHNGVLTTNPAAWTGGRMYDVAPISIGGYNTWGSNGTIDEVRIYNRSLSASEVMELYLSKGLVGYWKMDADQRNATSTFDSSGYYNHGLISGATLTNEGRFKEGIKFDGINDYIDIGNDLSLKNMSNGVTVSAWAKYNAYGGGGQAYSVIAVKGFPWTFLMENPSNKIRFRVSAGGVDNNAADSTAHELNRWYHFVGTYNGTHIKIYKDGVEVGNTLQTGSLAATDITAKIGTYQGTNYNFNGTIDEVRIYNKALTASEIADLYNGTKTNYFTLKTDPVLGGLNETPAPTVTDETALLGYWKMDDYTDGNTTDSSGNGRNGSVIAGTIVNDGRWGKAYALDGVSDYIQTATPLPSSNFSFSLWFKLNNDAITRAVSPVLLNPSGWLLYQHAANNYLYFYGTGARYIGVVPTVGEWHHLACSVDTAINYTGPCYFDGVQKTLYQSGTLAASTYVRIGTSSSNCLNGSIDDVRFYNRTLNATDFTELYLSRGLVGHWSFDADQKNNTHTRDKSGYSNHGLISGATLTNEGRFKEGYKFDGGDYIWIPNAVPQLNLTRNSTVTAWIKPSNCNEPVGAQCRIYNPYDDGPLTMYMDNAANTIKCAVKGVTVSYKVAVSPSALPLNAWTFAGCTYNYSNVCLWLNGARTACDTVNEAIIGMASGAYSTIGTYQTSTAYNFNGTIDEVRVYNRALSATEMGKLYNGTKTNYFTLKAVAG